MGIRFGVRYVGRQCYPWIGLLIFFRSSVAIPADDADPIYYAYTGRHVSSNNMTIGILGHTY